MRELASGWLLLVALLSGALPAHSQTYPSRPIRFIAPFPPGGGNDFMARALGAQLSQSWGQQVIIDNRPGANAAVGSEIAARAAPDGYTILMGNIGSHGINPALYAKLPYDAVKDFTAVSLVGFTPNFIVAHPSVPANNLQELIALAKAKPGTLNFGSSGTGSAGHLAGEMFKVTAGIDMVHVPYKGIGPATTDLLGGQLQLSFATLPSVLAHVRGGKLKAIAITSLKRSAAAPEVPAVAETYPGFDVNSWWGVMGPAGMPRDIVIRMQRELVRIIGLPEMKQRWDQQGVVPAGSTPEEFSAFVKSEIAKYRKAVKDAHVQME